MNSGRFVLVNLVASFGCSVGSFKAFALAGTFEGLGKTAANTRLEAIITTSARRQCFSKATNHEFLQLQL